MQPFAVWPANRLIVFVSGVGTDTNTAVPTFEQLAAQLASRLPTFDRSAVRTFSYSGRYEPIRIGAPTPRPKILATLPIVLPGPHKPVFESIDICNGVAAASKRLGDELEDLGRFEFDLVGHSFGGFVIAHLLATADDALLRRIHAVVTLDSPLAGLPTIRERSDAGPLSDPLAWVAGLVRSAEASAVARLTDCDVRSLSARDTLRDSDAVLKIQAIERVTPQSSPRPYFYSIGNVFDITVPDDISHARGSVPLRLAIGCTSDRWGHGCLLREPGVLDRVVEIFLLGSRQAPPRDDHGDTIPVARPIRAETKERHSGQIDVPDDLDIFRLPARPGQEHLIELAGRPDMKLTVVDGAGRPVMSPIRSASGQIGVRLPASDADRFVVVGSLEGGVIGGYELTVTPSPLPTDIRVLTVVKSEAGDGHVTSTPPGIDCGPVCAGSFANGTLVELSAAPTIGSVFVSWLVCQDDRCHPRAETSTKVRVRMGNTNVQVMANFRPRTP